MNRETRARHVVITGCNGGVGTATVARLRAHGFHVAGLDVAESPVGEADRYFSCDVTDKEGLQRTVAALVSAEGVPDVWVNNAGVGRWGPFLQSGHEDEERELAVNYHGSLNAIRAILPYWRAQGRGHLIQITSSSALFPAPNMATYAASKAATRALIQSLRVELIATGITVTEIVPNTIDTPMSAGGSRRWVPRIAGIRPALTPDTVAAAIHRAVLKRPREVHLPALLTPFYWLGVLLPRLMDRLVGWDAPRKESE